MYTLQLTCRLSDDTATTAGLLSEHVKAFNLSYLPDSPHQSITVQRWYIWSDVQRCFRKPYTSLQLPIKAVFVGEPAADQGGLRREFFVFHWLLQQVMPRSFLVNPSVVYQFTVQVLLSRRAFYMWAGLFQWLSYREVQDQLVWHHGYIATCAMGLKAPP